MEERKQPWLTAEPGPWDEYPGDEFGQAAMKIINQTPIDGNTSDYSSLSDDVDYDCHSISNLPDHKFFNYNSPSDIDIINILHHDHKSQSYTFKPKDKKSKKSKKSK